MSVVTKVFIVLLVVLSLMLSAGLVVFVNRVDKFNATITTTKEDNARLKAQLDTAKAGVTEQAAYAAVARGERDAAFASGQAEAAKLRQETADARKETADAQSDLKIKEVATATLASALNASEAARKAVSDILDTTRTDNNTLVKKMSDCDLAIADLTNKLEVATRRVTDYSETIAQQQQQISLDEQKLKDSQVAVPVTGDNVGTGGGAPAINAVVRTTRMINGIPYATISVGADAQVKKGMKFHVFDSAKPEYMGELTIDAVDEREATGKLEGPHVDDVRAGTEAKTQM